MKTAEVISRLNSKCGWNLKNNGGFSHTQLMIIEDTHIIVTKEIKDMIDDKIKKNEQLKENAKMFLQAFLIDIDQNRTEVNKSVKTHANEMVKTINHILTELRSKL